MMAGSSFVQLCMYHFRRCKSPLILVLTILTILLPSLIAAIIAGAISLQNDINPNYPDEFEGRIPLSQLPKCKDIPSCQSDTVYLAITPKIIQEKQFIVSDIINDLGLTNEKIGYYSKETLEQEINEKYFYPTIIKSMLSDNYINDVKKLFTDKNDPKKKEKDILFNKISDRSTRKSFLKDRYNLNDEYIEKAFNDKTIKFDTGKNHAAFIIVIEFPDNFNNLSIDEITNEILDGNTNSLIENLGIKIRYNAEAISEGLYNDQTIDSVYNSLSGQKDIRQRIWNTYGLTLYKAVNNAFIKYITGYEEFKGLDFKLMKYTYIPHTSEKISSTDTAQYTYTICYLVLIVMAIFTMHFAGYAGGHRNDTLIRNGVSRLHLWGASLLFTDVITMISSIILVIVMAKLNVQPYSVMAGDLIFYQGLTNGLLIGSTLHFYACVFGGKSEVAFSAVSIIAILFLYFIPAIVGNLGLNDPTKLSVGGNIFFYMMFPIFIIIANQYNLNLDLSLTDPEYSGSAFSVKVPDNLLYFSVYNGKVSYSTWVSGLQLYDNLLMAMYPDILTDGCDINIANESKVCMYYYPHLTSVAALSWCLLIIVYPLVSLWCFLSFKKGVHNGFPHFFFFDKKFYEHLKLRGFMLTPNLRRKIENRPEFINDELISLRDFSKTYKTRKAKKQVSPYITLIKNATNKLEKKKLKALQQKWSVEHKPTKYTLAVSHAELIIQNGVTSCILGESSSGKSTTLNILSGELYTDIANEKKIKTSKKNSINTQLLPTGSESSHRLIKGIFSYDNPYDINAARPLISYCTQEMSNLNQYISVEDNVEEALRMRCSAIYNFCCSYGYIACKIFSKNYLTNFVNRVCKNDKIFIKEETNKLLVWGELDDKATRKRRVTNLSGGQRRRLALICSCAGYPPILLLDEISSGVDCSVKRRQTLFIRKYIQEGNISNSKRVCVCASHDADEVSLLADKLTFYEKGQTIVRSKTPFDFRNENGSIVFSVYYSNKAEELSKGIIPESPNKVESKIESKYTLNNNNDIIEKSDDFEDNVIIRNKILTERKREALHKLSTEIQKNVQRLYDTIMGGLNSTEIIPVEKKNLNDNNDINNKIKTNEFIKDTSNKKGIKLIEETEHLCKYELPYENSGNSSINQKTPIVDFLLSLTAYLAELEKKGLLIDYAVERAPLESIFAKISKKGCYIGTDEDEKEEIENLISDIQSKVSGKNNKSNSCSDRCAPENSKYTVVRALMYKNAVNDCSGCCNNMVKFFFMIILVSIALGAINIAVKYMINTDYLDSTSSLIEKINLAIDNCNKCCESVPFPKTPEEEEQKYGCMFKLNNEESTLKCHDIDGGVWVSTVEQDEFGNYRNKQYKYSCVSLSYYFGFGIEEPEKVKLSDKFDYINNGEKARPSHPPTIGIVSPYFTGESPIKNPYQPILGNVFKLNNDIEKKSKQVELLYGNKSNEDIIRKIPIYLRGLVSFEDYKNASNELKTRIEKKQGAKDFFSHFPPLSYTFVTQNDYKNKDIHENFSLNLNNYVTNDELKNMFDLYEKLSDSRGNTGEYDSTYKYPYKEEEVTSSSIFNYASPRYSNAEENYRENIAYIEELSKKHGNFIEYKNNRSFIDFIDRCIWNCTNVDIIFAEPTPENTKDWIANCENSKCTTQMYIDKYNEVYQADLTSVPKYLLSTSQTFVTAPTSDYFNISGKKNQIATDINSAGINLFIEDMRNKYKENTINENYILPVYLDKNSYSSSQSVSLFYENILTEELIKEEGAKSVPESVLDFNPYLNDFDFGVACDNENSCKMKGTIKFDLGMPISPYLRNIYPWYGYPDMYHSYLADRDIRGPIATSKSSYKVCTDGHANSNDHFEYMDNTIYTNLISKESLGTPTKPLSLMAFTPGFDALTTLYSSLIHKAIGISAHNKKKLKDLDNKLDVIYNKLDYSTEFSALPRVPLPKIDYSRSSLESDSTQMNVNSMVAPFIPFVSCLFFQVFITMVISHEIKIGITKLMTIFNVPSHVYLYSHLLYYLILSVLPIVCTIIVLYCFCKEAVVVDNKPEYVWIPVCIIIGHLVGLPTTILTTHIFKGRGGWAGFVTAIYWIIICFVPSMIVLFQPLLYGTNKRQSDGIFFPLSLIFPPIAANYVAADVMVNGAYRPSMSAANLGGVVVSIIGCLIHIILIYLFTNSARIRKNCYAKHRWSCFLTRSERIMIKDSKKNMIEEPFRKDTESISIIVDNDSDSAKVYDDNEVLIDIIPAGTTSCNNNPLLPSANKVRSIAKKKRTGLYDEEHIDHIMKMSNISYIYPTGNKALNNIHMGIKKGSIHFLLGANGGGKTTLINSLAGSLKCTGTCTYYPDNGEPIEMIGRPDNCDILSYVPQIDIFFENLTIPQHLKIAQGIKISNMLRKKQNIAKMRAKGMEIQEDLMLENLRIDRHTLANQINTIIELFYLRDFCHFTAKQLSGGVKRRLSVAISLISSSKVVALDECTTGLGQYTRRRVMDSVINLLKSENKTGIVTTHRLDEVEKYGDTVCIIGRGETLIEGSVSNVRKLDNEKFVITIVLPPKINDNGEEEKIRHTLEPIKNMVSSIMIVDKNEDIADNNGNFTDSLIKCMSMNGDGYDSVGESGRAIRIFFNNNSNLNEVFKVLGSAGLLNNLNNWSITFSRFERVFMNLVGEQYEEAEKQRVERN